MLRSTKSFSQKHPVKGLCEGIEKCSTRSTDVETLFGDIKYNRGHRRFILRDLEKVNIEFLFLSIAHNLKKVYCEVIGCWAEFYAQRAARRAAKIKKYIM